MNNDNIIKQIDKKIEVISTELKSHRSEIDRLNTDYFRLIKSKEALTGEYKVNTGIKRYYSRPNELDQHIIDYVTNNPGQIGSYISKGIDSTHSEATFYNRLRSLVLRNVLSRDEEKKYYPVSIDSNE